jgi:Peptidase C26
VLSKPGLVLQHGDDGPPTRLGEWLAEREHPFVVHRAWVSPPPDPRDFSFVVSLGSERSATDSEPGWLPHEIATLRTAVESDVPVLGLCFGGQVLSVALGGGVRALEAPEIGWLAVESLDGEFPRGPWLQYHYELMLVPRFEAAGTSGCSSTRRPTRRYSTGGHVLTRSWPRPALLPRIWPPRAKSTPAPRASTPSRCLTDGLPRRASRIRRRVHGPTPT